MANEEHERTGPPFAGETSIPADIDLSPLEGILDDALTGPLTPGQVRCRVCQLDDRTRAASSPDDLLCTVCRANEPLRRRKQFRDALGAAAEKFFGIEPNTPLEETAEGSAELDLRRERVDTLMRLADLVDGHMLPYKLVNVVEQTCAPVPDDGTVNLRESDADAARQFAGQCIELQKRVEELEANERSRLFVEKSLDRLKPQLARRIAEVICPSSPGNEQGAEDALMTAERLVEAGLRFVPSTPEVEAAVAHLCYIIAGPNNVDGTPRKMEADWDGNVYMEFTDQLRESLLRCRETYDDWGVFGLVRVPDEVVFGTEADRG